MSDKHTSLSWAESKYLYLNILLSPIYPSCLENPNYYHSFLFFLLLSLHNCKFLIINTSANKNKTSLLWRTNASQLPSCKHNTEPVPKSALALHFPLLCSSGDLRSSAMPKWFPLSLNPHKAKRKGASFSLEFLPPLKLQSDQFNWHESQTLSPGFLFHILTPIAGRFLAVS